MTPVERAAVAEQIASLDAIWLVLIAAGVAVGIGVTLVALRLVVRDFEENKP